MEARTGAAHRAFMVNRRGRPRMHTGKHPPNRIEQLRLSRGWSQAELGQRCAPPLTELKISRLERRLDPLHLDLVYRLADALEVHRIEIFEDLPYTPREGDMLRTVRSLRETERDAVFRMIDGLNTPAGPAPPSRSSRDEAEG